MFKVECCKKKTKCRVWALADKKYKSKFLKQAICPICGQKIAIIERVPWFGEKTFIRENDEEAENLIEKVSFDILFEFIPVKANERHGFYLKYSEYGKIKKCYSNLSTLRLGFLRSNFEDVQAKRIFA